MPAHQIDAVATDCSCEGAISMGLDFHAVNFLRYVHKYGDMGDTITIARQELHVNRMVLERLLPLRDVSSLRTASRC